MEEANECTGPGCGKAHIASTVKDLGGGRSGLRVYLRAWRRRAAGDGERLRAGWDARKCPLETSNADSGTEWAYVE